jgi:hypothetical protein
MQAAQTRLSSTTRNDIVDTDSQQQSKGPVELDLSLLGQIVGGGGPVGGWKPTGGPVGGWSTSGGPVGGW